jgi:hypothetical protein
MNNTKTFLPGVALLRKWFAEKGTNPHRFAIDNSLDESELSKILRGVRKNVSVTFAAKVEDATEGDISMRAWVPRRIET